jgi:hypothetical protein
VEVESGNGGEWGGGVETDLPLSTWSKPTSFCFYLTWKLETSVLVRPERRGETEQQNVVVERRMLRTRSQAKYTPNQGEI